MIDVKDIKVGDEIIIKGAVADIKDTIRVDFGGILFWVRPEHIVEHTPKPHEWAVGDIVGIRSTFHNDGSMKEAEVLGVHGIFLWLDHPDECTPRSVLAKHCTFVRRKSA